MNKVSILILTYNRLPLSKVCIPGIIDSIGDVDYEILIWDNHSNDGTYDWLLEFEKCYKHVRVFGSDRNYGVEAINFLVDESSSDYILKVDDDISVPRSFAERLISVSEMIDFKCAFLAWDMVWGSKTFATRSGTEFFVEHGSILNINDGKVFVSYKPKIFMVNGACRLSKKSDFLKVGGHPKGAIYGIDYIVAAATQKAGLWQAFFSPEDLVVHLGIDTDTDAFRKLKDAELKKHGCPKHV